jgi:hypothetical protein
MQCISLIHLLDIKGFGISVQRLFSQVGFEFNSLFEFNRLDFEPEKINR